MIRTAVFCLVAFAVTSVLFINFCNLAYGCGCHSLWDGADAHCNIHNKYGKHCPWCSHGEAGYGIIFNAVLFPQFLAAFAARRRSLVQQLLITLLSFPISGGIVAVVVGVMDGYWKT